VKRRFYKNWYRAKKKCFHKYRSKYFGDDGDSDALNQKYERIVKYCTVVRALVHTQPSKLNLR
jgi:large subunit ribosomal protein L3e